MAVRTSNTSAAAFAALLLFTNSSPAPHAIGQIKTETGTVTIERGGTKKPAAIGDHVFQSDTIVTAANGTVGITFADNSMMSLGPNSRLGLDQFQFNATTHVGIFDSSLQK